MDVLIAVALGWALGFLPGYLGARRARPEPLAHPEGELVLQDRIRRQYDNLLNYKGDERGQLNLD